MKHKDVCVCVCVYLCVCVIYCQVIPLPVCNSITKACNIHMYVCVYVCGVGAGDTCKMTESRKLDTFRRLTSIIRSIY